MRCTLVVSQVLLDVLFESELVRSLSKLDILTVVYVIKTAQNFRDKCGL